jgi:type I restriction enzyme M protein
MRLTKTNDSFEILKMMSTQNEPTPANSSRIFADFWNTVTGSTALGNEQWYAFPFLCNLMLDTGVDVFLKQLDHDGLAQVLATVSSRSATHKRASLWVENTVSLLPASDLVGLMRHCGAWFRYVDEERARALVVTLLDQIPSRTRRINSFPKEVLRFMAQAAQIPENGSVYVPYPPSFGFSPFLPPNSQSYFQFQSEEEAGIFAVHEVILGGRSQIEVADPQSQGTPFETEFSATIAAPPMNVRTAWNEQPMEIRCIENALSVCKPDARLVFSVSPPFLMNQSGHYKRFREFLTCGNLLEAVMQLPTGLLPASAISFSLIVLKKNRERQTKTFFIDASKYFLSGRQAGERQLDSEKLTEVFGGEQDQSADWVDQAMIASKEFDFTPARYFVQHKIELPENHKLYRFADLVSTKHFSRCKPTDSGMVVTPRMIAASSLLDPRNFDNPTVVTAESLPNMIATKCVDADALLINSIFGKDGLAASIFQHRGRNLLLRAETLTFEVFTDKIEPLWLVLALRSENTRKQLEPFVSLVGIPRVRKEVLMDLILAVPATKQEQRALIAQYNESELRSRAREADLESYIQSITKGFLDDMRLKKHSISQIANDIKSAIAALQNELESSGSISADQIISRRRSITFDAYLQRISERCSELNVMIDKLTDEGKHETPEPLHLAEALNAIEEEFRGESFGLSCVINESSFADPATGGAIEPAIRIGGNDFKTLYRNIIDNAKRHAFRKLSEAGELRIDASFHPQEQEIELCFRNNGAPFPNGMDFDRFVLRGEKAGLGGNSGTGGYHIQSIMDHVGGRLEIDTEPVGIYVASIKLFFPIHHENAI